MIEPLQKGDALTLDGTEYTIEDIMAQNNTRRYVYRASKRLLFRGESHGNYYCIIKEILPQMNDQAVIERDSLTNQAVFHGGLSDYLSAEEISAGELLANYEAIQDKKNVTNSDYVFLFNPVSAPDSCAAYFIVDTVSGCTFAELPSKWKSSGLSADQRLAEATNQMIHASTALQSVHEKGYLHLDIKPSNLFAVGDGHYSAKILDFGSAVKAESVSSGPITVSTTASYRSSLMKEICGCCSNGYNRDLESLAELCSKISLKDDLCALSKVFIYLLTGTTNEKNLKKLKANRFCMDAVYKIVHKAHEGGKPLHINGRNIPVPGYENTAEMTEDLKKLSEALSNKGVSETVMLKKGENYIRQKMSEKGAYVNGQYRIDSALIPVIRRKSDDNINETPVNSITELIGSEKKNLFINSEGGAGKTYLLWRTYLDYAECREMTPIYIPLNKMTSLEDFLLYFIANEYTGFEGKDKASKIFSYFENHTDQHFLILADGLNEIPTTKSQNRTDAINNLLDLSKLPNVSMVVTSRREDNNFSRFEQYELAPLDEVVLRAKLPYYDDLSSDLKCLLTTPFNLSLYLHLPEVYRNTVIETATDLLEANIKWLRDKLKEQGVLEGKIGFLFDMLLPVLSYQMSQKNKMYFLYTEPKEAINLCEQILSGTRRYVRILDEFLCKPDLFMNNIIEILADNSLIYISLSDSDEQDEIFIYHHENYRNYFAAMGWKYIVKHFKFLYKNTGKAIAPETFVAPMCILNDLKDMIINEEKQKVTGKSENGYSEVEIKLLLNGYFNRLFDKTTRHMLHNETAASFNAAIFKMIHSLFICKDHSLISSDNSEIQLDFSFLDLSQVDFCNTILHKCSFFGSVLSECAFKSKTRANMPDEIYCDENVVLMMYKEGFMRALDYEMGVIYEEQIRHFDACCIYQHKIYVLYNNVYVTNIEATCPYSVDVYDIVTGCQISRVYPRIREERTGLFHSDPVRDSLMYPEDVHAWIGEIFFDCNGVLHGVTCDSVISFRIDDPFWENGNSRLTVLNVLKITDGSSGWLLSTKEEQVQFIDYSTQPQKTIYHCLHSDDLSQSKYIILYESKLNGSDYEVDKETETIEFYVLEAQCGKENEPIRCCKKLSYKRINEHGDLLLKIGIISEYIVLSKLISNEIKHIYISASEGEEVTNPKTEHEHIIYAYGISQSPSMLSLCCSMSGNQNVGMLFNCSGTHTIVSHSRQYICSISDGVLSIWKKEMFNEPHLRRYPKQTHSYVSLVTRLGYPIYNCLSLFIDNNRLYKCKKAYNVETRSFIDLNKLRQRLSSEEYQIRCELLQYDKNKWIINYGEMERIVKQSHLSPLPVQISYDYMCYVKDRYVVAKNDIKSLYNMLYVFDIHTQQLHVLIMKDLKKPIQSMISSPYCESDIENILDNIFVEIDNILYRLKIDINEDKVSVYKETEILPSVWLENCDFRNVDIMLNSTAHLIKLSQREDVERIKKDIIQTIKANNITDIID